MIILALAGTLSTTPPLAPSGKWTVEYAKDMCVLSRDYGAAATKVTLALRPYPMGTQTEVVLLTPGDAAQVYQGKAELTLLPAGQPVQGTYSRYHLPGIPGRLSTLSFGQDALAGIQTSTAIALRLGGKESYTVALPGVQAGMRALATCQADLLKTWGISADEQSLVATPPHGNPARSFGPDVYPHEAIEAHQQGLVIAVAAVDARGAVKGCAIVATSGSAALDRATCETLNIHAHFLPGLDKTGTPVARMSSCRCDGYCRPCE